MENINIKSFGPIQEANVELGDFTLLVGPQASGKSIFLQLVKLIADNSYVNAMFDRYGYIIKKPDHVLELFLGEGMSQIWNSKTEISFDGDTIKKDFLTQLGDSDFDFSENVFYIPAQRVLALQNGWPKPFSDYGVSDPFVLKNFSEFLRLSIESSYISALLNGGHEMLRDTVYRSVFYDAEVEIDKTGFRKRLVLNINNAKLPYMSWSAGQKEFMPLWLSLQVFNHPVTALSANDKVIIIEEPEMGLHPQAIKMVIIEFLNLIAQGYQVIVSTHSPVFLEFAWAFKAIKDSGLKYDALYEMFDLEKTGQLDNTFKHIMNAKINTYYFDREDNSTVVKNISTLDAGSEDSEISEWGGLSSFSGKAADLVLKQRSMSKTAKAKNVFETAVENTPDIAECYQAGLKALGKYSKLIDLADTTKCNGSVDIDDCTKRIHPQDNRWDYVISYNGEAYFVEVHSAETGEVSKVLKKLQWLQAWLVNKAPEINNLKAKQPFFWIQSGRYSIQTNSPQYRRLVNAVIQPISKLSIN